ncbi:AAA family ATPase [Acinetobacter sp. ABJ_C3_5]|uniref:AAA family ATPase n=1 Tax=Acinetobacter courvalinii TaxID=280147 RepID=UPI0037C9F84A
MKITSIEIKDVGGIPYLKLENLDPKMNIICGENGVGKTNILDSISYMCSQWSSGQLTRRANSQTGRITIETETESEILGESIIDHSVETSNLDDFDPKANRELKTVIPTLLKQAIYLRTLRDFFYKQQKSIESDPDEERYGNDVLAGVSASDLKGWFISRFFQYNSNILEEQYRSNFELALGAFEELNKDYSFNTVTRKNEIMVNSHSDIIYFEYLSSGFKSSLFIILGIIKEIEFRFQSKLIQAKDYAGFILIDEIELHLHPEWQGKICEVLKKLFPKAQFFISTHSPHVIQTAGKNEVIALVRADGEVIRRDPPDSDYGYQGWTIEEILEDVMGMPDLRTKKYNDVKDRFDRALDNQNKEEAQAAYDELDRMLHPEYELRQVFNMQLNSLGD